MSEVIFSVFPSENFIDLGLYQFGWEKCDPSHSFGPAARNHYLFHYCISGTGILYANNAKGVLIPYSVKSGQGFMCFPNQINMYIADREIPWEYVWIEFDGLRAKETIELTGLSPDQPVYKARYKDLAETMKSEMLYIVEHKEESPFHLIGHLYLFIDSLVRSCSLNRSYFGKIFHENMETSPQEFLISYRMTKAAELLKLTSLSISDISNAVGYPNQLHFSRAFKHVYGIPPRQWRYEHGSPEGFQTALPRSE